MSRKLSPSELATKLSTSAAENRLKEIPAEMAVKDALIALGFEFQSPMLWHTKNGGYGGAIFDFYHPEAQLVVEIDDDSHKQRKGRDRRRDARFGVEGIDTLRFTNREALKNPDGVVGQVTVLLPGLLLRRKQEIER